MKQKKKANVNNYLFKTCPPIPVTYYLGQNSVILFRD